MFMATVTLLATATATATAAVATVTVQLIAMCDSLYTHQAPHMHRRDVKPGNVLMTLPDANGIQHVKLCDFGEARQVIPSAFIDTPLAWYLPA